MPYEPKLIDILYATGGQMNLKAEVNGRTGNVTIYDHDTGNSVALVNNVLYAPLFTTADLMLTTLRNIVRSGVTDLVQIGHIINLAEGKTNE